MIKTIEANGIKWHNLHNPSKEDLDFLGNNFDFHELDLDDVTSYQQRPKIDVYKDYIFFVIHLPIFEGRVKIREVDLFVGKDYVITVTTKKYELLDNLFDGANNDHQLKKELFEDDAQYLFYTILDKFISSIFPIINHLGADIDVIDRSLIKRESKDVIEAINLMRRNLVVFHTLLKPEINIFSEMEQGNVKFFDKEMNVYWGDVSDHLRKISDQLDDYRELLEGLAVSSESLISHRTNEVIKILTIFSVIFLPLTLIASIYGMNVPLWFQDYNNTLPSIGIIMLGVVVLMLAYFKAKRWF
jgi:magnesium transporter